MLSNRPYLLRAFNEWIIDSACTPILVLDATNPRCKIPQDYAEGGEIVFNISPAAVRDLRITNDAVEFKASFSGIIHIVTAPIKAILAIYAEENGEGIFFDADEDDDVAVEELVQLKSVDNTAAETVTQNMVAADQMTSSKSKPFLKLVE